MRQSIKKQLLEEVKEKLRITWPEEDVHVWRLVEAAIADLSQRTGRELDFSRPGPAKTLMLEHVFYNYNNALHEFLSAYSGELMALALKAAMEEFSRD